MKTILNIFRTLISFIILVIFLVLLTLTPVVISVTSLVTHRENILSWVSGSDAYTDIADLAVVKIKDQLKEQGLKGSEAKIIGEKLAKAITPAFVMNISQNIVHGVYDWAEGKTTDINVETKGIDVASLAKDLLPKEQLGNEDFMKVLSNLKPCTEAQAQKYEAQGGFKSPKDFCLPPSLNIAKVAGSSYDNTFSPSTPKGDDQLFQVPQIPQQESVLIKSSFLLASNIQYILGALLVLLLALYILVTPTKYFKMYAISFLIIVNSLISIFVWTSTSILAQVPQVILNQIGDSDLEIRRQTVEKLISLILHDIASRSTMIALIILAVGSIILAITIVLHLMEKRKEGTKPATTPTPSTTPAATTATPKAPVAKKTETVKTEPKK